MRDKFTEEEKAAIKTDKEVMQHIDSMIEITERMLTTSFHREILDAAEYHLILRLRELIHGKKYSVDPETGMMFFGGKEGF